MRRFFEETLPETTSIIRMDAKKEVDSLHLAGARNRPLRFEPLAIASPAPTARAHPTRVTEKRDRGPKEISLESYPAGRGAFSIASRSPCSPGDPKVLPRETSGYPWSVVGTAFDYRLRYFFAVSPMETLVAFDGAQLLSRLCGRPSAVTPAFEALAAALCGLTTTHDPRGRVLPETAESALCSYCYLLALFEQCFRAPLGVPLPLHKLGVDAQLEDLLQLCEDRVIEDLVALASLFYETQADLLQRSSFVLNPTFAASKALRGADADLILGGRLLDIKTLQSGRPRREHVWQLAGYLLADWEDEYGIREVGFYFARHGLQRFWPVEEFLGRLANRSVSLPVLRDEFREVCAGLLPSPPVVLPSPPLVLPSPRYERRDARVERALLFRPPVSGKGKWHVAYAENRGVRAPTDIDPFVTPSCGSPSALDRNAEPLTPSVGERRESTDPRLCRRCLTYTDGFYDLWADTLEEEEGANDADRAPRIRYPLTFHPPAFGKGKWHVPVTGNRLASPLPGTPDPTRAPSCHSDVLLDPAGGEVSPDVGKRFDEVDSRLCRRCLLYTGYSAWFHEPESRRPVPLET